MTLHQFQIQLDPLPNLQAVFRGENVRFTILTDRLIRMEYSPSGVFEDQASQAIWYRNHPEPKFDLVANADRVEIETEYLHLHYRVNPQGFTATNLQVIVKTSGHTWHYGDHPYRSGNLGGTYRTLDEAAGFVRPDPGLMASTGAAVYDDSKTLVFNDRCWLEPRAHPENKDLYFFGYGFDFASCLRDLGLVAGRTPMVPRYILGNWWSRYWRYSDEGLLSLMRAFKDHNIPISVCIVDMDWHLTETGNTSTGWTGYTWNRELFPDPEAFIDQLHQLGLKTALNLHPADGIHPHEEQYQAFAKFLGVDPESNEPIPFDIANPKFAEGYFNLLHHPHEEQGIDFWWIDWQQGERSSMPGLDPLTWLNHLHFYDLGRDGVKRPFIFSRWGGFGNHRYPIGFSGDTVIGWDALDFQPGFTSTAANVGYGWWSHDIGGHMGGVEEDELYTRWVQYGVFSPILRMHCTNNPFHERRPWGRGLAAEKAASRALRLRHALIPYIYTMSWRNYQTGLPLITPIYYTDPNQDTFSFAAYNTYWFGSELLAAPFTKPANLETKLSRQTVWLPGGTWFDFFTGECLQGGGWHSVYGTLEDIPVFAKAGAIVPLGSEIGWGGIENPDILRLFVFPGANNAFELYEDDGETTGYQQGLYALTKFTQTWNEGSLSLTISPVVGEMDLVPGVRDYQLHFRGVAAPDSISISHNDSALEMASKYDSASETLELGPIRLEPCDELIVTLEGDLLATRERDLEKVEKYLNQFRIDTWEKAAILQDWPRIRAREFSLQRYRDLKDAHIQVLESLINPRKAGKSAEF
jgi:alpha-glucosidase (family GH31 glycosyl hydrolase)